MEGSNKYIIGIDGGGTKTFTAIANLAGKIIKTSLAGPSNFRNVGLAESLKNIKEAILEVASIVKKEDILSIVIALASFEEEPEASKRKIETEITNNLVDFKGKIKVVSDQLAAFYSGADKDGLVLISGTGCVAHGWRKNKEAKASGWGWLCDEGSGFWIGQKAYQAIFKDLDGRGEKTLITELLFKEFKINTKEELMKNIYYSSDFIKNTSLVSIKVREAAEKKDKIAKLILIEAAKELTMSVKTVIRKLNFKNSEFPLVFVGKVFNSEIVLKNLEKEIKKFAKKVKFVKPKAEPVLGAINLAIKYLNNK
jgi:N-acetylglucosamine kinase-like BadF-type ATPase